MGAIHPGRLAQLKDRMQVLSQSHESNEDETDAPPAIPPFLYGSHYSSPGMPKKRINNCNNMMLIVLKGL